MRLFIYLSINKCLFIYHSSIFLSIILSIYLSFYLSIFISICLCTHLLIFYIYLYTLTEGRPEPEPWLIPKLGKAAFLKIKKKMFVFTLFSISLKNILKIKRKCMYSHHFQKVKKQY